MKRLLSFILGVIATTNVYAQNAFYSEPISINNADLNFNVTGWTYDHLFCLLRQKGEYKLMGFNDSMRLDYNTTLEFLPRNIDTAMITNYYSHMLLFYFFKNEHNVIQSNVAYLDPKGFIIGDPIPVVGFNTNKLKGKTIINKVTSPDGTLNAITRVTTFNNTIGLEYQLIDEKMNTMGTVQIPPTQFDFQFNIKDIQLTNTGNLVILSGFDKSGRGYKNDHGIAFVDLVSNSLKFIPYNGDHEISELMMKIDTKFPNKIYLGGMYSERRSNHTEGCAIATIQADQDNEIQFKEYNILQGIVNQNVKWKQTSGSLNQFVPRDLIPQTDGGMTMIMENYFVQYSSNRMYDAAGFGGMTGFNRTSRTYIYGDVLSINFDADHQKNWHNVLYKNQVSLDDNGLFSGFQVLNSGLQLGYLYNKVMNGSNSLQLGYIDEKGNLNYKEVAYQKGNNNGQWMLRKARQTDISEFVVPLSKRGEMRIVKINF